MHTGNLVIGTPILPCPSELDDTAPINPLLAFGFHAIWFLTMVGLASVAFSHAHQTKHVHAHTFVRAHLGSTISSRGHVLGRATVFVAMANLGTFHRGQSGTSPLLLRPDN